MEHDTHGSNNKRSNYSKLIILGFVLVLLAVTNPTKENFVEWVVKEASEEADSEWVAAGIDLLGGPIIKNATTQQDFIFVSVFNLGIGTEKVSFLGLGKSFFIKIQ